MTDSISTSPTRRGYWQAQGLIERQLSRFQAAAEQQNLEAQRRAFYHLATYHGRTLHILNTTLPGANDTLAQSALHNLMALHRALTYMHQTDRDTIPLAMVLPRAERDAFLRDLLVRTLAENSDPLSVTDLVKRVGHLDMLGQVGETEVQRHLQALEGTLHISHRDGYYSRTQQPYVEIDVDSLSLRALSGDDLYPRLAAAGFAGLTDVDSKAEAFRELFSPFTGLTDPAVQTHYSVVTGKI